MLRPSPNHGTQRLPNDDDDDDDDDLNEASRSVCALPDIHVSIVWYSTNRDESFNIKKVTRQHFVVFKE